MENTDTEKKSNMLKLIKSFIPKMTNNMHKGQAGRIAVIGGCQEYTGAPYYSAISALRVGCDLVHVFCTKDASSVIKTYSPELIVHPVLDEGNNVKLVNDWLDRMHAVVLGPGLGRNESLSAFIPLILTSIRNRNIPLIIDADGLWMVTPHLSAIDGYSKAILTPNIVEFSRLYKYLFDNEIDVDEINMKHVSNLSNKLNRIVILVKGSQDLISDGVLNLSVNEYGSKRRCGGQGDILSGSIGTFAAWGDITQNNEFHPIHAAYAASLLVRHCTQTAFETYGRSMLTTDIIPQIGSSFKRLFE